MPVNTKSVQGRRVLRFASLDEAFADAEMLVASPTTRMLGNWPLGALIQHLATSIDGTIDDAPSFTVPWYVRRVGRLLKGRILGLKMRPGFSLPADGEARLFPAAPSPREALQAYRAAVGRLKAERMTAKHPVFGPMDHREWTQLHLRHAELHLGFAAPGGQADGAGAA